MTWKDKRCVVNLFDSDTLWNSCFLMAELISDSRIPVLLKEI